MRLEKSNINNNHMIITGKFVDGIHRNTLNSPKINANKAKDQGVQSFRDILRTSIKNNDNIKFSKHATQRMFERDIILSTDQLQRMENALKEAKDKGVKDSLILMEDMAFIVNIPSKTVITAMNNTNKNKNIFTNIDSAIII